MSNTSVYIEDYEYILQSDFIPFENLQTATVLISGGTGLIGSTLINALLYANQTRGFHTRILAVVRNSEKAKSMLRQDEGLVLLKGSVENLPVITEPVDYIVHAASPTSSRFFMNQPVETIQAGVLGTMNLLGLAKEKCVKGFVYLSSMEAYGTVLSEAPLKEADLGYLNPAETRSCYPECKRMCEAMCHAYATEYRVPACSVRLAQTFGPGISRNDQRVFAMMARNALAKEDIILQTKGNSRHSYLYTAQAVTAVLTVLLKGVPGSVYNAANPDTYCSIYEMAEMVAEKIGRNRISVRTAENGDTSEYPAPSYLNLDISALTALGWRPTGDLLMLYERMIAGMDQSLR